MLPCPVLLLCAALQMAMLGCSTQTAADGRATNFHSQIPSQLSVSASGRRSKHSRQQQMRCMVRPTAALLARCHKRQWRGTRSHAHLQWSDHRDSVCTFANCLGANSGTKGGYGVRAQQVQQAAADALHRAPDSGIAGAVPQAAVAGDKKSCHLAVE